MPTHDLTPQKIVLLLDQHIVGQDAAKRSVAIAVRNRWRRQQLSEELRQEVNPKNILMIGPTGVGKTEIARRLAKITGAPFIKVEATKFTEVGYYGRDVESMIRELVENAIVLVKREQQERVAEQSQQMTEERLLDLLCGPRPGQSAPFQEASAASFEIVTEDDDSVEIQPTGKQPAVTQSEGTQSEGAEIFDPWQTIDSAGNSGTGSQQRSERRAEQVSSGDTGTNDTGKKSESSDGESELERHQKIRAKMQKMLRDGKLDERMVELSVPQKNPPMVFGAMGGDQDRDLQSMLEKFLPKNTKRKKMTVKAARKLILEQVSDSLLDEEQVNTQAIELAENLGVIFLDEIDKVISGESRGADVSRQGVQRDLLPIVEGTTVQTRYGQVKTDHILFVAAGAFHHSQPSDLMPELQGRFPIRVELTNLTEDDFVRILTEPNTSLTRQYVELLKTEHVDLLFADSGIRSIARFAHQLNQSTQNIGARRLHTMLEKILEDLSFSAADRTGESVTIDADYVTTRLKDVIADQDLSRFIL